MLYDKNQQKTIRKKGSIYKTNILGKFDFFFIVVIFKEKTVEI